MKKLKPLIVILGPTASGKTDLAIKLAKKFKGEIVSADSRQIYKGMDIGTAKPKYQKSKMTRRGAVSGYKNQKYVLKIKNISHYLIDIIRPDRQFNVALYKKRAIGAIKAIIKRKKVPFLVGGTGLYISSIVDNIDFPTVAPQSKLREKLEKKSTRELFKIYKKLDPAGAKFIDKKNKRRLVRAVEVSLITKKPFWIQRQKKELLFKILQIGLKPSKKELKKRIEKRTEEMIKSGLEKEVRELVRKYGWNSALQTIGYQEWKEYFDNKISKEEVEELIVLHTLQFARRQMTWFRKDRRIYWLNDYQKAEKLIKQFLKKIRGFNPQ